MGFRNFLKMKSEILLTSFFRILENSQNGFDVILSDRKIKTGWKNADYKNKQQKIFRQ